MMKVYKLTNKRFKTYDNTQWGEGIEHTASGEGELCGSGWLHAYEDPRIAVLLNPIHGGFNPCVLWEADGDVGIKEGPLKLGCTRLKTIRIMDLLKITTEQKILFAIACAKQVYDDVEWNEWADRWISGEDRSKVAAIEAARMAWTAAEAKEWAAAQAAEAAVKSTRMAMAETRAAMAVEAAARAARAAEWGATEWAADAVELAAWTVAWTALKAAKSTRAKTVNKTFDIYAALEKAKIAC